MQFSGTFFSKIFRNYKPINELLLNMKKSLSLPSKSFAKTLALACTIGIAPSLHAQQSSIIISGTVFQDGNGGTIDGMPVGRLSISQNASSRIYVYLLDNNANNTVLGKVAVDTAAATRGQYSISAQSGNNYNLRISTTNTSIGTQNPSLGFPSSFVPTAEGNSSVGDGTPDFGVSVNSTSPVNIDFAVDARPQGASYYISNPSYDANNRFIIPAVAFTASDAEDGDYPSGLVGRSVDLFQAMGGTLFYNGTLVSFATASTATRIANFDRSLLKMERNAGASTFSFAFATVDNAGVSELAPNTISIGGAPLSVPLFSFEVNRKGTGAIILWTASPEAGGLGFEVERSFDGRNFTTIGHVASVTESSTTVAYRFEDGNVPTNIAGGKVYYRLRQTSFGGNAEYSKVAILSFQNAPETTTASISLYPNPAANTLYISLLGSEEGDAAIVLSDATGHVVSRQMAQADGKAAIDVSALPVGVYFMQYRSANGTQVTERVSVAR